MEHRGLNQHRLDSNPLERAFAEAWEAHNKENNTLDNILHEVDFGASKLQKQVAATVIQWLGSPVGLDFLKIVNGIK